MPPKQKRPAISLTVDVVALAVREDELCVLVVKRGQAPYAGRLALPGGFVEDGEDLPAAARRELLEETGVKVTTLDQVGAYGAPGRDPRGRTVSVAHVAVLSSAIEATGGDAAAEARWEPVEALLASRRLAFDHRTILRDALELVRGEVQRTSLATAFVGREFTLSELRRVYELVWDTTLDPGNFQRKILFEDLVAETGKTRVSAGGRGRPAAVYRTRGRTVRPLLVPLTRP